MIILHITDSVHVKIVFAFNVNLDWSEAAVVQIENKQLSFISCSRKNIQSGTWRKQRVRTNKFATIS